MSKYTFNNVRVRVVEFDKTLGLSEQIQSNSYNDFYNFCMDKT